MINVIETLFGIAIVSAIAALVLHFRKNALWRRGMILLALATGILGGLLEIYVRIE